MEFREIRRIVSQSKKYLNPEINPDRLKLIPNKELPMLCRELRQFIIDEVLHHGGHFSANLGTIELSVALHYVLSTPNDQLVWDVGHQAYAHKILTGRMSQFHTIRKKDGLSGFPTRDEGDYDIFGTGHSSTSISAVLGMAEADKIAGSKRQHVAVIGDGSLTAGMAWEALNNAGVSNANILIVINDNNMGIDPNAGALNHFLSNLSPATSNFLTDLGFTYSGPDDGHDVIKMVDKLGRILQVDGPKIWHIKTVKGKGYKPAEEEQTKWHAVKYVKIKEEEEDTITQDKFQHVFGKTLLELALENDKIIGVTPAMPSGCSMNIMMHELPSRVFDVGIAEQHAVTFSAGLAVNGFKPFCNIYSTFLQRAYDQVIHDVCIQNLPVVFCLDRSGVVGEDGATHHGLYDISMLRNLPNLVVAAPCDESELRNMMYTASNYNEHPISLRYPKGFGSMTSWNQPFESIEIGKGRCLHKGNKTAFVCIGTSSNTALEAAKRKKADHASVYDMRFVKPIDEELLEEIFDSYEKVITVEDGVLAGGFGSAVAEAATKLNYKGNLIMVGYPTEVIGHATRDELLQKYKLDVNGLSELLT